MSALPSDPKSNFIDYRQSLLHRLWFFKNKVQQTVSVDEKLMSDMNLPTNIDWVYRVDRNRHLNIDTPMKNTLEVLLEQKTLTSLYHCRDESLNSL